MPAPVIEPAILKRLDAIVAEHAQLAQDLEDPAILADHKAVRDRSIRKAALDEVALDIKRLRTMIADIAELEAALKPGGNADMAELAREELPTLLSLIHI